MRFTFDKDTMIKEISIAQEIISTKNMGSILSNILIIAQENKLTIKATDIKVNFETQVPVQITEEGTTTVYCDKFMGILNSLPSCWNASFTLPHNCAEVPGYTLSIKATLSSPNTK